MAPGLEFVHPRGTGVNDLQFLESVIPVAVRPTDDILRFLVGRFDISQRNLLLAVRQDPVKMFFNHDSKALERFHPAPLQGGDPFPEELHGPYSGSVLPEMTEGLLEEVRLEKPGAHKKELGKGLFGLRFEVGSDIPQVEICIEDF